MPRSDGRNLAERYADLRRAFPYGFYVVTLGRTSVAANFSLASGACLIASDLLTDRDDRTWLAGAIVGQSMRGRDIPKQMKTGPISADARIQQLSPGGDLWHLRSDAKLKPTFPISRVVVDIFVNAQKILSLTLLPSGLCR